MSVYLDVNVIVALFAVDPLNARADKTMRALRDDLVVSDLSAAEFSAVIARRVRTRDLRASEAQTAFANFDIWCAQHTRLVGIQGIDVAGATALMRRLDFPLRTPDALHVAIAQRTGCALMTFDAAMAKVARVLRIDVIRA
ncbi:MAG: type II toxin-antitoxin system VapC family toxin [Xanthobacteraceae bacterium]